MRATHRFITLLVITGAVASSLAGCGTTSGYDATRADSQPRRDRNVLTAEQIEDYPPDYAVSRILTEAFPGFWARSEATGTGSPLIVLNGVPGATVSDLRARDIQRIEVQNDAASMALWGFRGSSGVILISTFRASSAAGS